MKSLVAAFFHHAGKTGSRSRDIAQTRSRPAGEESAPQSLLSRLRRSSLRAKGRTILALFMGYSILVGAFVMYEKGVLLKQFVELQELTNTAGALGQFNADALLVGDVPVTTGDPRYTGTEVAEARASLRAMWNEYAGLTASVPEVPLALERLDEALKNLAAHPSEAALNTLRTQLISEHASLTSLSNRLRQRRDTLAEQ